MWRRRITRTVVAALLLVTGCTGDDDDAATRDLTAALLTTSDLRTVSGLPDDVQATDVSEITLAKNPDPRGPCGAEIAQPDLGSDAAIGIRSPGIVGVHSVLRPTEPSAEEYLDANLDDTEAGCAPWQSTTNTGSTQTVTLLGVAPDQSMPDGVDEQLGVVLKIEDSGQTAYAGVVIVRAGEVVSQLAFFGAAEVSVNTVVELMLLAAVRLGGS